MTNLNDIYETDDTQYVQQVRDYYDKMNPIIVQDIGTTFQGSCLIQHSGDPVRETNLFLASRAGMKSGDYVLDAGCGAGGPAVDIAQSIPNLRIDGINLSEAQVNTAKELVQQAGLSDRVRVQVGDFHNLPFGDSLFDIAYYFESVEHSYNPERLFTEAYRVLRPQGTVYIKLIAHKEPPLSKQEQRDVLEFNKYIAYRLRPLSEFVEAIQTVGFCNIESQDMSQIMSLHNVEKAMYQKDENGNLTLTEFGKHHDFEIPSNPIYFAEIKAYKPIGRPAFASKVS